jgi:hypothetical protein
MPRVIRPFALLAAIAVLLAIAPAASAKGCSIGNERSYGTTYVTKISVSGTSCRSARTVVRAFHACRPGAKGKCGGRPKGYSCSESRFNKGRTSYDSNVTCRKGGRTVKHTYTQFI